MAKKGKETELAGTLRSNRESAVKLAGDVGVKHAQVVLKAAADELKDRLDALGGRLDGAYTAVKMRATLKQIQYTTANLTKDLRKGIVSTASIAAEKSAGHVIDYLKDADDAFRGVGSAPLAIDEAAVMDRAKMGADASVLRRLSSGGSGEQGAPDEEHPAEEGILARYGTATIAEFEKVIQQGVLQGKSMDEIVDGLTDESPFLQGKPRSWAERIARTECLLGNTPVDAAVVSAVHRRWYEGDVVEVVTERGRKFTATPNHPMLSTRAWVAASDLKPGDDLVCDRGKQDTSSPRDEDVAGRPPTIGEVFDSVAAVGVVERRRTTQPDFHGDGLDGDVEIARPNGPLTLGRLASIFEPLVKKLFAPSDLARARFCRFCRHLRPTDERACFCWRAKRQARFLHAKEDCSVIRTVFGSKAPRTLTSAIASNDLLTRQLASVSGMYEVALTLKLESRLRERARNACLSERASDAIELKSEFERGLRYAQPADVELDRVLYVQVRKFAGHVFNLSTPHGYFTIAGGAYTGNCLAAYNKAGLEGAKEADEDLGDMCKILCATFDDRTAADSYAVHGEIRRLEEPFEMWQGFFQNPPARSNDREVVVYHRISWPIPPGLKPRPYSQCVERYAKEKHKEKMPPRPEMTTIDLKLFGKPQPKKEAVEE